MSPWRWLLSSPKNMVPFDEYVLKNGDPALNGKLHEVMDYGSVKYVLEPRQEYMTLAGEHRFKVGMKTKIADNSEKGIGDNQMNNILADLAGSFLGGRGVQCFDPALHHLRVRRSKA